MEAKNTAGDINNQNIPFLYSENVHLETTMAENFISKYPKNSSPTGFMPINPEKSECEFAHTAERINNKTIKTSSEG